MKSKFLFLGLLLMTILGSSVATWAVEQDPDCGVTSCQGGNAKCCTNKAGSTFYMEPGIPPTESLTAN